MDESLRCNSLPCRKALQPEGRAVSTSCSHIFCYDCATKLLQGRRICPACNTPLESPDDAIVTSLNPSSSYKASVLAGLSPQMIMEICSRAIAFYHYQTTQEAVFQQMLLRKAQETVTVYERELDRIELAAKTEISHLEAKVKEMQSDMEKERRKTRELQDIVRSSGRDYEKLKMQYDQTKRDAARSEFISKASSMDAAAHALPVTPQSRQPRTSIPQPFFSSASDHRQSSHSPHPLISSRLTNDAAPMWHTPSHASDQGLSKSAYPTSKTFGRMPLSRSQTPRKPAPDSQSINVPSYLTATGNITHDGQMNSFSRTPLRSGRMQNGISPIRAMPLPSKDGRDGRDARNNARDRPNSVSSGGKYEGFSHEL